jgi:XTP/dITP diphosphohydrolase
MTCRRIDLNLFCGLILNVMDYTMRLFNDPKLLIASGNSHKIREIAEALTPYHVALVTSASLKLDEPEETGTTFQDNARLKAHHYGKMTGLPCLADDSGLVIPALGGQPGIYSARWAQTPDGNDNFARAIERIANEMATKEDFSAYFVCALSLVWPDGYDVTVEGIAYGHLTFPPRGEGGFGYDSLFIPKDHAISYAEMMPEQKQRLSHRAVALRQLIQKCFIAPVLVL